MKKDTKPSKVKPKGKNRVKYPGILLDERLFYNSHIETQLSKAKKIFIMADFSILKP